MRFYALSGPVPKAQARCYENGTTATSASARLPSLRWAINRSIVDRYDRPDGRNVRRGAPGGEHERGLRRRAGVLRAPVIGHHTT
jgi:hypothetical protein